MIITAFPVGFFAGLFGIGGGLITVPFLFFIFSSLDIDPNYVKAWCKKGDIEFFMKEFHKSMESYQKGLSLDQTDRACMDGLRKVSMKINETSNEQEQQERAAHGLADPEIQRILQDPMIQQVLRDMQENPMEGQKALADPGMRAKIQKLVAAGVLKVG